MQYAASPFQAILRVIIGRHLSVMLLPMSGLKSAALLGQQGAYLSNAASCENSSSRKRALGLCNLLGAICTVEAPLVARGEFRVAELLIWLVDASGGGGGLGIEGAMSVVDAWPRLVAVPVARRAGILQGPLFANVAQVCIAFIWAYLFLYRWWISAAANNTCFRTCCQQINFPGCCVESKGARVLG